MSDSDEDDLFGGGGGGDGNDSDDTADLIAASKPAAAASKKKPVSKKKVEKKKADSSSDDEGLFDSDDDDDDKPPKKKKATQTKKSTPDTTTPLSKREKMQALLARRKKTDDATAGGGRSSEPRTATTTTKDSAAPNYDSEGSYDSAEFQRTAEDDAFIDTTGEDADAVQELYAAQHFGEDYDDDDDDGKKKKNKKRRYRSNEAMEDKTGDGEPDNPVMAAVHRMKKKKRAKPSGEEMEQEIQLFLQQMDQAATVDEQSVQQRQPATRKLQMLNQVCEMLTRRDRHRLLLDMDLLSIVVRWVQPLPNGTLGNVTVRQRLLEAVYKMNGSSETGGGGVTADHLKQSGLGKTVMVLYQHRQETPAMKRQLKQLVDQWSRPIFQKSGNLRDLERATHQRGDAPGSLASLNRQQQQQPSKQRKQQQQSQQQDFSSMLVSGKKGGSEASSSNRVRVPYSQGFAFSVRPPTSSTTATAAPEPRGAASSETRDKIAKRMVAKGRPQSKNQRSANMSIEGRVTKG